MSNWTRPDVYINKEQLAVEQIDRSTWLDKILEKASQTELENWSEILKAVAIIEAETQGKTY